MWADQDLRGTAPGGGAPGPPGAPKGGGIEPVGPDAVSVSQCHWDEVVMGADNGET